MLQIHQAYFGAVNGTSHGQLASSLADKNLRAFLAGFTDRSGVPPAGYTLQPYLAATSFESYFLICRTWPDLSVERQGMVFTHVLLLPLQQLAEVPALGPVLDLLVQAPPEPSERTTTLVPLTWSAPSTDSPERINKVPVSWLAVMQQLVGGTASTSVYTLGDAEHFRALLEALWMGLPASLRTKLSWGIRFAPPTGRYSIPQLVYVPAELEVKWRGQEVIRLDAAETTIPELPIDQLIFDNVQGKSFRDFIGVLDISPELFATLKRCQRAFQQYNSLLASTADVGELLALVRSLRQLQPDPTKAVTIKQQAIGALATTLLAGGAIETEAMALRGVPMDAFPTGIEQLGDAVGSVVKRTILAGSPNFEVQTNLLEHLAEPDPAIIENWWCKAATTAFTETLAVASEAVAKVIWLGLAATDSVRAYVVEVIPNTTTWEQALSQTVPESLSTTTAEAVTAFSARRNWWDLFAATVGAAYAPAEALSKQIKAEKRLNVSVSPRVSKLAKQVAEDELVKLAVELPNRQLQEIAGEVCGRNSKLLLPIDVTQQSWRTIWSVSLSHTKSITAGLSKPVETIDAFLSEVANGRANDIQPLELIAASTYANVLHLPERTTLWERLPKNLQPKFIAATLNALIAEILANKWEGAIDHILLKRAQSVEFIGEFLGQKRNTPADVLAVNAVLHNLTDIYLKDYIKNLTTINSITAVQLGQLVARQRWSFSANAILNKAKYNMHFLPALAECSGMFSLLDKILHPGLFGHQISKNDAWNALEDLMAELYEEGPGQEHIWKNAGGDTTKLTNNQTRREQWATAIRLLRHGGGGKSISAETLIHTALKEYKNNPKLQALASLKHHFKP